MFDWVYGPSSCCNGIKIAHTTLICSAGFQKMTVTSSNSNYRIMQILLAIQNHVTEKQYYNVMSPIISYKRTIKLYQRVVAFRFILQSFSIPK